MTLYFAENSILAFQKNHKYHHERGSRVHLYENIQMLRGKSRSDLTACMILKEYRTFEQERVLILIPSISIMLSLH
tara:strand:+ start:3970 stop:4197 length:228 start_codon:yes stop_codon:yes gene_type:complete